MAKKKTTKQIRAIDRLIKFQLDDGIESLTIGGKTDLADIEIDNKNNVTLHVNADGDKLNEVKSLVPFITIDKKETGNDPDKKKTVELIQDLREFALELENDSEQLAEIIKKESSIIIDLSQLIIKLNKMVDDIDTAERKAERAEGKANTAQETAERAEGKANTAQETAERAEGKADDNAIDLFNLNKWYNELRLLDDRFEKKIIDNTELLGSETFNIDNHGNLFVNPNYNEDLTDIKDYFTTSANVKTVYNLAMRFDFFYAAGSREFIMTTKFETPSNIGLNYYSVSNLVTIGKLFLSGYDIKTINKYFNIFNMALELNLVPFDNFFDNVTVSNTVTINLTHDMLETGKQNIITLENDDYDMPNQIMITPISFTVEQTITNDKYNLYKQTPFGG